MITSIIAAVALENRGIGFRGDLCYKISDDLKRFKNLTMGHPIIMGSKTFESLPKRPLPGRMNIVISSRTDYPVDVSVFGDLSLALQSLEGQLAPEDEVFIIGGGRVYSDAIQYADRLYLTEIHGNPEADVFFPEWRTPDWKLIDIENKKYNDIEYDFTKYDRVSPVWRRNN